jgi:hypothetical protein
MNVTKEKRIEAGACNECRTRDDEDVIAIDISMIQFRLCAACRDELVALLVANRGLQK